MRRAFRWMRRWEAVRSLSLVLAVAWAGSTAACGGAKPRQAGDSEMPTAAHDAETPSDMNAEPSEEKGKPSGPTDSAAPTDTEGVSEAPCSFDTSKPLEGPMGTIRIAGCLSPSSVMDSVKFKWRAVSDCFDDARKADPKAKGSVEIRIGVGKKGVRSVQVPRSEIPSDTFIQCVIDTLRDMPMPKPEHDTATVIWTTKF